MQKYLHILQLKIKVFLLAILILMQAFPAYALFDDMSVREEVALGEKFNIIMKTQAPLLYDPIVQNYLQSIVNKLLAFAPPQNFTFEVNMVLDKDLNAFAAPGGFLYINSGLFLALETESELAGIMAHEIAHVTERHIAERQRKSSAAMLTSLLAAVVGAVAASQVDGNSATAGVITGSIAAAQSAMLNYSRQDENEADNVGFEYMTKANYNPLGYITAFQKLQNQFASSGSIPTYLSTHPDLKDRIANLDARIRSQADQISTKEVNNDRFLLVQNFVRAQFDTIENAKLLIGKEDPNKGMTQLALAIISKREHKLEEAKEAFLKALKIEPNNPLFLREYGAFQYKYDHLQEAYDLLVKSYQLEPSDYLTRYYLARTQEELGHTNSAQNHYLAILKKYPHDSELHNLLGRSYGKNGMHMKGYLHLAYAALYSGNIPQAMKHFAQAEKLAKTDQEKREILNYKKAAEYYSKLLKGN